MPKRINLEVLEITEELALTAIFSTGKEKKSIISIRTRRNKQGLWMKTRCTENMFKIELLLFFGWGKFILHLFKLSKTKYVGLIPIFYFEYKFTGTCNT